MEEKEEKVERRSFLLSGKLLAGSLTLLCGVLLAGQQLSTNFVVPEIIESVMKQTRTHVEERDRTLLMILEEHKRNPHEGAVSRREFDMLSRQIDQLSKTFDKRLERIEESIRSR
jgi:hypothetical protein